jgi:hypothetical protein
LSVPNEMCENPKQTAYFHNLNLKLDASSLTWNLPGR